MLNDLCGKMKRLGYPAFMIVRLRERVNELQQSNVHGIEAFLRKLSQRIDDKQDYLDILMEGRFAVILAKNGFTDIYLEFSGSGTDMRAVYSVKTVYFEMTRRRAVQDEWKLAEPDVADFIEPDRTENVISKIIGKVGQLQHGETNIVVVWSDTIGLDVIEMGEAFGYIQQEIANEPEKYRDLSAVLFTTRGVNMATLKQFYVFKNNHALKTLSDDLTKKLESFSERDVEQLQKEHDDLAKAMKKPHAK